MTSHFVVDASIAIAWVHPAQATAHTEALLHDVAAGARIEAPALWPLEIANALLVLVRRRKLRTTERHQALSALHKLSVSLDYEMSSLAMTTLSDLADQHQLSIYDATYLELAQRKQLPLACKDGPLRAAAHTCAIQVL